MVWRADPVTTHPRLLERLRLPGDGRELVVVDERRTATAAQADAFVELPADRDVEALWTLRALVREAPVDGDRAAARRRSPRGCAAAATARSCTTCAGTSRRSRSTRSSATSARVTHAVAVTLRHEAQRRRRRGRARVADRVPGGRELRAAGTRARTRAS